MKTIRVERGRFQEDSNRDQTRSSWWSSLSQLLQGQEGDSRAGGSTPDVERGIFLKVFDAEWNSDVAVIWGAVLLPVWFSRWRPRGPASRRG